MAKSRFSSAAGTTLAEVLVATGILTFGLLSLGELFGLATQNNVNARTQNYAAVLADQKMEQLRGLTWGFDTVGLPLSDVSTNTAAATETPTGGTGLAPSPGNTLQANTPGYVDYLDANGTVLGGGATAPAGTIYTRRWSIEPLPTNPNDTIVIQVLVTRQRDRGAADLTTNVNRLPTEARIVSVKTRKSQ